MEAPSLSHQLLGLRPCRTRGLDVTHVCMRHRAAQKRPRATAFAVAPDRNVVRLRGSIESDFEFPREDLTSLSNAKICANDGSSP